MPDLTKMTDAHTVALHSLINDMRHVLEWLTIGLGCLALMNVIHAIGNARNGDWIGFGFDALFAVAFAAFTCETAKRASKYKQATR